ncbi:unnamed protein product [Closterium sp. NIES-54]
MATLRVMRFDAEGRPLEFSVWRSRVRRLLESQCADLTAWNSRDAAACIAFSSLLPESKEAHFTQVRTASEFLTAIKARYATPTAVSLGRLFLPFLFPDLTSFERSADLIAHLRSLDSSNRVACTAAQLALIPRHMAITIYFIATSLLDCLASVCDTILLKHPSELTTDVLESALKDVERNLRSASSALGTVPPPLFHGCTNPQLPTFTASLTTAATYVGGQGAGGGGGVGEGGVTSGGGGSAGVGGAPRAAPSDSPAAAGRGDTRGHHMPAGLPTTGTPHAMYDVVNSSASDSIYSSVFSLGASVAEVHVASVDTSPGAAPEDASLTFTLDSGASHCFFPVHTMLTPLPAPLSLALADPTSRPVTPRYTTTLSCPAVPSGFLTAFHVPSFSRNLVGVRPLVDSHVGVWIEPSGDTPTCVDGDTYAPLATFHAEPGSVHYTLHTGPQGRQQQQQQQQLPPTPLVTHPFLIYALWLISDFERESFFLVVVDDYSRCPTVFPLAKKSEVTSMLVRWLLTTADTRGHCDSCLHSDRGGEFRSRVLAGFCREQGIRQSWMLPESPQQNGVAERRIGLVMDIARTSMIHTRAPHFLWPYAVQYAAHQLNLWPRVSRPGASPTSLWTGSPGVASRFRVWGCLARVRDTSADKISPRAIPCVFLGFPKDSSGFTFYHPPLHRFFDSHDVRFDESVPYNTRYPCRGLPVPPPPLFLTPTPPPAPQVQPPPPGPAPSALPPMATTEPEGAGVRCADPGSATSGGAGVGSESVPPRVSGAGGAGVGVEPKSAGGSSLGGAGVSRVIPGGATTGGAGAPSTGPGEPGTDRVAGGGAGSGGGATSALESGHRATNAPDTTPPPHPYPTRHQARVHRAREEQLELEQEERELERQQLELQQLEERQQQQQAQQLQQEQPPQQEQQEQQQKPQQEQPQWQPPQQEQQLLLLLPPPPPISGLRTLSLPSLSPTPSSSPPVYGPTFPPPDSAPAVFPRSQPP